MSFVSVSRKDARGSMKSEEEIRATIDASNAASGSPLGSSVSILLDTLPPAPLPTRRAAEPHALRGSATTSLAQRRRNPFVQRRDRRRATRWDYFPRFNRGLSACAVIVDDRKPHRKNASNPASVDPASSVHQSPMSNPSRRPSIATRAEEH